ncbi:acyltransferase [Paenarthrobacter ureafaciens]
MKKLTSLADYADDLGNIVESPTKIETDIVVTFRGSNNRIIVEKGARIAKLRAVFDCDNGTLIIGASKKTPFSMSIRVGQDATVKIGRDLTTTTMPVVSAVEGATVSFGDDVMIASGNQFRADDGHPIFDVETGRRINPAKDIIIGHHVWFGAQAVALAGAQVGDGSVIGFRSLVTGSIPNNAIAVGAPAKVVRKNIAWERPHLSFTKPPYKPDASSIETTDQYWNLTAEDVPIFEQLTGIQDH